MLQFKYGRYTPNRLNQYEERWVSGNIEVYGESPAAAVLVNGQTAYRHGSFYHHRVELDNSQGPLVQTVGIQEVVALPAVAAGSGTGGWRLGSATRRHKVLSFGSIYDIGDAASNDWILAIDLYS